MTTYALNGLGRIGKLALKPLLDRGAEIAWLNDAVGDPAMHAHLLEFDTIHGRWDAEITSDEASVTIDGTRLRSVKRKPLRQRRRGRIAIGRNRLGKPSVELAFRVMLPSNQQTLQKT